MRTKTDQSVTIAIVGRPNVGKSTLFNRLIRRREALVADQPGVTRDRHYGSFSHQGREFLVIDTGGFEPDAVSGIEVLIRTQAEIAVEEAELILFVVNAREGILPTDRDVYEHLRKSGRPMLIVANKVDSRKQDDLVHEFHSLGGSEVWSVSAEHDLGVDELLDEIASRFPRTEAEPETDLDEFLAWPDSDDSDKSKEKEEERAPCRVALVGKPNAGKSALLNQLIGEPRAIVSDIAGTTRDPINSEFKNQYGSYVFVDTAGIRRKHRHGSSIEQLSTFRAMRSVKQADIVCLVIDAQEGPSVQDAKIADLVLQEGRGLILVLNKMDLFKQPNVAKKKLREALRDTLPFADFVPSIFLSSLTGNGVRALFPLINRVAREHQKRITTAELNRFFTQVVESHPPPADAGRNVRLYFITQVDVKPPTFVTSSNNPKQIPTHYQRYMVNQLRQRFSFEGTPIRLFFKGKG